jgi:phage baseplate assembly protein gpV
MNLRNLIRIGKVSSINYEKGTVRVLLEDKDNIVTHELPFLAFEYEMPAVGEHVICVFLGNSHSRGFCLGRYFYLNEMPAEYGKDIYFKRFVKDATLKYDRATKTWTLTAENIVFNGDLVVNGNVYIDGEVEITGDAVIGGISFLNHGHPYSWTDPGGSSVTGKPQ